MRYVAAHKPALLKAKLTAGRIQKIKFEITDAAGTKLKESDEIPLVEGKAEWNWTPNSADDSEKTLPDEEDFIKVGVRIFWFNPDNSGSGGYEYLDDLTVFRDQIKIKVLAGAGEDEAVDKANVRIVVVRPGISSNQKMQAEPASTTGEVTFKDLLQWTSIQVIIGGAWVLKNAASPWKADKDKGLNREVAVIAKKYKASMRGIAREGRDNFVAIDELGDTRIQFVNFNHDQTIPLVGRDDPDDHYGHRVKIRVGPEGDNPQEFHNEFIYVSFTAETTNSKRNDPKPGLAGANAEGILELRLNNRGVADCEVELGYAGGDIFTLKVCSVKDFSGTVDQTLKFQNWRKLFYELGVPQAMVPALSAAELPESAGAGPHRDLPAAVLEWLPRVLDPVFIKYQLSKSFVFANDQAMHGAHQFQPATFYERPDGRDLYIGSFDSRKAGSIRFTSEPHTINIYLFDVYYADKPIEVMADIAMTTAEQTIPPSAPTGRHFLTDPVAVMGYGKHAPTLPASTWVADLPTPAPAASHHPGYDEHGRPRSGTLPATSFQATNYKAMKITLPGEPAGFVGAASTTKCPIKVRYFVHEVATTGGVSESRPAAGAGKGKLGVSQVVTLNRRKDVSTFMLGHELGHAINMTIMKLQDVPPGLDMPKHVDNGGVYYRSAKDGETPGSNGIREPGVGEHCATGLADKTTRVYAKNTPATGCIMYGYGPASDAAERTDPILFCSICIEYAKAQDLSRLY
jgi:hypothetical protein